MVALLELLFDVVANAIAGAAGLAPERPLWLRRFVQTLWVLLGLALIVSWALGAMLLIRSLT